MPLQYTFTIDASDKDKSDIDRFMEGAKALLQNNWDTSMVDTPTTT